MDGLKMYGPDDEMPLPKNMKDETAAPPKGIFELAVSDLRKELTEQIALNVDLRKRITELETANETLRKRLWQTASELVQERHKEAFRRLADL